jgi:hypothetical protein
MHGVCICNSICGISQAQLQSDLHKADRHICPVSKGVHSHPRINTFSNSPAKRSSQGGQTRLPRPQYTIFFYSIKFYPKKTVIMQMRVFVRKKTIFVFIERADIIYVFTYMRACTHTRALKHVCTCVHGHSHGHGKFI